MNITGGIQIHPAAEMGLMFLALFIAVGAIFITEAVLYGFWRLIRRL